MNTNNILKRLAGTSARSGPVFSAISRFRISATSLKYTFPLKSPMFRRRPSREPWQHYFWWIHHRRCLVRFFRARQPGDIPKLGQKSRGPGSEFSSGAPKIINFEVTKTTETWWQTHSYDPSQGSIKFRESFYNFFVALSWFSARFHGSNFQLRAP